MQASDNTAGCQARWRLTLRLPGGAGSLTTSQLAESFGPCGGGLLRLSPFYPRSSLARAIRQLHVAQSPPPYRTTRARTPARAPPSGCGWRRATAWPARPCLGTGPSPGQPRPWCLRPGGRVADHHAAQCGRCQPDREGPGRAAPRGYPEPAGRLPAAHSVKTDLTPSRGRSASIALETETTWRGGDPARDGPDLPGDRPRHQPARRPGRAVDVCGLPRVSPFLAGPLQPARLMAEAQALGGGTTPDGDSPAGYPVRLGQQLAGPDQFQRRRMAHAAQPDRRRPRRRCGRARRRRGVAGLRRHSTGTRPVTTTRRVTCHHSVGVGVAVDWMMAGPGRELGATVPPGPPRPTGARPRRSVPSRDVPQTLGPETSMDIEAADPHGWN